MQMDGAIGNNGSVLYKSQELPGDMKGFIQRSTGNLDKQGIGNAVIMGYKTWLSLGNYKPLKNRITIVISRSPRHEIEELPHCFVMNSIESAIAFAKSRFSDRHIIIAGGAEIYNKLLPKCDEIYATEVFGRRESDTKIDLSLFNGLKKEFLEEKEHNGIRYHFTKYSKISDAEWINS